MERLGNRDRINYVESTNIFVYFGHKANVKTLIALVVEIVAKWKFIGLNSSSLDVVHCALHGYILLVVVQCRG